MTLIATRFDTPAGPAAAFCEKEDGALVVLELYGPRSRAHEARAQRDGEEIVWNERGNKRVREQLDQYFRGKRREFDLQLAPRGTAFQNEVWDVLLDIPFGTVRTYGDIAAQLGRPGASRAVGLANGSNPIWIVVPCHRVIGSDGTLTGYAGGIDVKRQLLELEGAPIAAAQPTLSF